MVNTDSFNMSLKSARYSGLETKGLQIDLRIVSAHNNGRRLRYKHCINFVSFQLFLN